MVKIINENFTLGNCLFESAKLTKKADSHKYKYSLGIGYDWSSQFPMTDESWGKNIFIFGADDSSSVYIDSKIKNVLVFGK